MTRSALSIAAALLALSGPALGQPIRCGTPEAIAASLLQQYGETIVAAGVSESGPVVAIYANQSTGTWTITAIEPRQPLKACVSNFGDGWSAAPVVLPGSPS